MYVISVDSIPIKKYPFKIQATVWALLHGYVYTGYDEWKYPYTQIYVLDPRVKIRKVS